MTNCFNCVYSEFTAYGKYPYTIECNKYFMSIPSNPNECTNFESIYCTNKTNQQ